MNESTQAFIQLLKAARREKKLTQRALAKWVGVPQSHISNIENGKVNLQLSSLIEIARVLELEPMLIPRRYVPAVKGFMDLKKQGDTLPAIVLDEEDDDA